ncbi:MAG: M24 family metallopeptidase, partial [Cyanobacteria bacterium P01_E01_bin.48]
MTFSGLSKKLANTSKGVSKGLSNTLQSSFEQIAFAGDRLTILSKREIEKMRAAGQLAAQLLLHLEPMVQPGVSTLEINDEAERWTQEHGAISAPLGYNGFPKSICTSVNQVVCHGIPNGKQILRDG